MAIKSIPATKAKNSFAELIDASRSEAVTITRNNRAVAVVLSPTEYERLVALDDAYWGERARKAQRGGYVSKKETTAFLNEMMRP